jgi:predicted lipoprotein
MTTRLSSLRLLFLAALVLGFAACDSGSDSELPPDTFDRSELLENMATDIIVPSYAALQQAASTLDAAVDAFAADPTAANLAEAQTALKTARLAWQDASLFQFGPAESVALRASLNTYPVDVEQVEANVAAGDYVLGTIENRDAAGLPTLGYLLHGVGSTEGEILAAYTDAPDAAARIAYLQDNIAFVADAVDATAEAWSSGGAYLDMFLSEANAGVDVGSSLGMLINAFVLHYERFIRDGKIGIPAGVRSAGVPRPTSTEATYGGYSAELATASLRAAQRLFLGDAPDGTTGTGLDDYLQALDAEPLAARITTEFGEAVAAVEVLEDPLSEQIERDNDPVLAAFQAMQDVVVLLKADMTSILGVTITFQDNDGD